MQQSVSQIVYQAQAEYGEYPTSAMYIPVSGAYYQAADLQINAEGGDEGQEGEEEQQEGHYLVIGMNGQPGNLETRTNMSSMDLRDRHGAHVDVKFCQQEMQFLHENYEAAEGASLPRSAIYNQYLRHCKKLKIEPMNAASFGKLIRLVFAGIKTRRLGTRGNSKYHYYGIRIKSMSLLNQLNDVDLEEDNRYGDGGMSGGSQTEAETATVLQRQHQQFLGDPSAAMPDFTSIEPHDNELLPEGVTIEHLAIFERMYREHCEDILEIVVNMQLLVLPALWQSFWNNPQATDRSGDDVSESSLPTEMIHVVSRVECVQKFVRHVDYAFYTGLLDILLPDILRPIPSSLTLVLRNFAKNLEGWLASAMVDVASEMINVKMTAVNAFSQLLRRYTSLNHLAQAARTVLQNSAHVNQMLSDLNKVDFVHVQEQAAWVCQCDDVLVYQLESEIKKTLQQRYTLEQWASWLDTVTNQILQEHIGTPDFSRVARQFILHWSFYSSMVLRDLTLRSATSFGSFHLIRLLFDEYMFYTIENKVAAATGISPIAAFGNIKQFVDRSNLPPLEEYSSESVRYRQPYAFTNTMSVSNSIGDQSTPGVIRGGVSVLHHPHLSYQSDLEAMVCIDDQQSGIVTTMVATPADI